MHDEQCREDGADARRGAGLAIAPALAADDPGRSHEFEIVGTEFRITMANGRVLAGADLVGPVLNVVDDAAHTLAIRIDGVQRDPQDPSGETMLYTLMVQDPASGVWQNMCAPDAEGLDMGFPVSGAWTPAGEHLPARGSFGLTCTSGAIGKCVRMGYKPWQRASDGMPLRDYLQACVRMVRADYCGDGVPHTRDGMRINVYDRLGIQVPDADPTLSFEAAWGPDGAVCVRHVRVPEEASLAGLVQQCPARLASRVGPVCTEEAVPRLGDALIMNASGSTTPAPGR